ncbi:hypothetical protein HYO62_08895 [Aerococcaceae bacterium DSM 111022]|nr:hypothetical protein [Aerococcaceae bacterium DSM 111022]
MMSQDSKQFTFGERDEQAELDFIKQLEEKLAKDKKQVVPTDQAGGDGEDGQIVLLVDDEIYKP